MSAPPPFVRRFPRASHPVWALLVLAFCAPLIVAALKQTRMVNNVETWLPSEDSGAKILRWAHENFEPENRFLFSWDTSSLADPRVLELAGRLRPAKTEPTDKTAASQPHVDENPLSRVTGVVTPHNVLTSMLDNGVTREDAVHRLTGVLVGTGLLKIRLTDAGRARRPEVEQRLIDFAGQQLHVQAEIAPAVAAAATTAGGEPLSPDASVAATAAESPDTAESEADDHIYRPSDWAPLPHDFQIRWTGLHPDAEAAKKLEAFAGTLRDGDAPLVEAAFFAPGAPVAVSVSLSEMTDVELRETLAAVRRVAEEVGISLSEQRLGGSPIGRVQLNLDSARSMWNPDYPWWKFYKRSPLGLSAVVGTLLAFLLLRSVRLAVLVLIASIYTAVATVALIPATGQTLNSVLVVMPNLLLVLTMSGAIHLANYWRHASCLGRTDPVGAAVRMAFEPCMLASVTTAIGLASLLTSVLDPVRQFGLYSAIGCLLSLAMVLWAFPAMLRLWPGTPAPLPAPHEDVWHQLGLKLARHGRAIVIICLGLFIASAWGLKWFRTETKVIRYFPPNSRIVQDYQFLEDNLAGLVGVDVILRFPPDEQASAADDEESADAAPASARPRVKHLDLFQRLEIVREVQERLQKLPDVSGTLSLADFRRSASQSRTPYGRRLQIARKQIFETYAASTREFVTHADTPLSVEKDGVPYRVEVGEEVWRIRTQCSALTERHYGDFLREFDAAIDSQLKGPAGVEHLVTGMVPLFLRTQEAVLESLINSFGLAFIIIAGVMMYLLRSVTAGAITMLPNILPVGVVFGAISWAGVPIDIGTMITASVALGIAIDGTLHLLTWFRDGLERGLSRSESIARAMGHCAPAMWQTSAAIALGLLMLGFADLLLISRFGWLMSALIMAALLGDLVYLPGLLAGQLGALIERSVQKSSAARRDVDPPPLPVAESATHP